MRCQYFSLQTPQGRGDYTVDVLLLKSIKCYAASKILKLMLDELKWEIQVVFLSIASHQRRYTTLAVRSGGINN